MTADLFLAVLLIVAAGVATAAATIYWVRQDPTESHARAAAQWLGLTRKDTDR